MSTLSFITEMCTMFIVLHGMKMYTFKFSCRHDRLVICSVCLFWPSAILSNVNANFFQMTFISLAVWEQYPSFWNLYVLIKKVIGRVPIIQSRLHRNSCHSNLYISWCEAAWDITAAVRPHIRRVFCTACVGYLPLICPLNFMSLFVVDVIFGEVLIYFPAFQKQHSCHLASSCSAWYFGVEIDFSSIFLKHLYHLGLTLNISILINKANNRQQNLFLPSKEF